MGSTAAPSDEPAPAGPLVNGQPTTSLVASEVIRVMPYTMMVGLEELKLALEVAFIAPRVGGVLLSGQRGTGKSTVVRAFAQMVYGRLPITLPINATEDRVVGGWEINRMLSAGELVAQPGLLEQAHASLLYIDEVNLLDDHIVNIILDVTSTGVLVVEREGKDEKREVRFTLVGTMNPAEGGLRPQLLDRFGLMVNVIGEQDDGKRVEILNAVLEYDAAIALESSSQSGPSLEAVTKARENDNKRSEALREAKERFNSVKLSPELTQCCVEIGKYIQAEGHRGDYILALTARACAALRNADIVLPEDIVAMAPLALQHRRPSSVQSSGDVWSKEDTKLVSELAFRKKGV